MNFSLDKATHKTTPIPTTAKITIDESGAPVEQTLYINMIKSLLYLIAHRPDNSNVVGVCARF